MVGASGYAGITPRLLLDHPAFEILPWSPASHRLAGCWGMSTLSCLALADRRLAGPGAVADLAVDIAFLSLPHGESATLARALPEEVRVVDLGADHRLRDPQDWQRAYGGTHAGTWPYGLPELPGARAEIAHSTARCGAGLLPDGDDPGAAPAAGCRPRGAGRPRGRRGQRHVRRRPVGQARPPRQRSDGDLTAYKVATTSTCPRCCRRWGTGCTLSFTPVLAPMPRGILATATARLRPGVGTDDLYDALQAAYADEPFIACSATGALAPHGGGERLERLPASK